MYHTGRPGPDNEFFVVGRADMQLSLLLDVERWCSCDVDAVGRCASREFAKYRASIWLQNDQFWSLLIAVLLYNECTLRVTLLEIGVFRKSPAPHGSLYLRDNFIFLLSRGQGLRRADHGLAGLERPSQLS